MARDTVCMKTIHDEDVQDGLRDEQMSNRDVRTTVRTPVEHGTRHLTTLLARYVSSEVSHSVYLDCSSTVHFVCIPTSCVSTSQVASHTPLPPIPYHLKKVLLHTFTLV
jgi:hypothetical protein